MHKHPLNQSRRPRVLVAASTFPRWENDSEPAFVFELSRRLSDSFDITVLAPRSPGSKETETIAGLGVIRFPYFLKPWENLATHSGGIVNRLRANPFNYLLVPFFLIGLFLAIFRLLRTEQFDMIHAHWIVPQGLAVVLAVALLRKKIPVICTSHGGDLYTLRGKFFRLLKQRVIERCDALTVVSRAMRETVVEMGVSPDKVEVISMGVDLVHFYTPDPSVHRSNRELLFVGRFVEKKGLHVLLSAMPKIIEKYPDVHLTVAGDGPLKGQVKQITRRNGLSDKVHFLGMLPQSELPALYRRAAIAVFPFIIAESGDQEGLGLVVVEAMGCECPVIASSLPALKDTVEHGKTGLLFEPGNPEILAQEIIQAFQNPEKRAKMAVNARQYVLERFDWGNVAGQYAGLYFKHIRDL